MQISTTHLGCVLVYLKVRKLYVVSASEVTTIWRYTNVYIIIIIIIVWDVISGVARDYMWGTDPSAEGARVEAPSGVGLGTGVPSPAD